MDYPDDFLKRRSGASPKGQADKRALDRVDSPFLTRRSLNTVTRKKDDFSETRSEAGSDPGYQFFSTGKTVSFSLDDYGFAIYSGYAAAVGTQGKAAAWGSSLEASVTGGKSWKHVVPPTAITLAFPRKKLWQIEGISQHAFYPFEAGKTRTDRAMITSWSNADPLHSLGLLGGAPTNTSKFDIGYDAAPNLFPENEEFPLGANGLAPDADWYKRAAFRKVTHAIHGTRTFIILTDISGTFHVYPTGRTDDALTEPALAAYPGQAIKTNVPEKYVQRAVVPWPAWCRQPTEVARNFYQLDDSNLLEYLRRVPQYRWALNGAATRACCVVFEDLSALALDDPALTVPFKTVGAIDYPIKESLPGLLELALHISLTGPNSEDFTFSLEVVQALQPTVSKQFVMAADYAWEIKEPTPSTQFFAEADDLMLALGEVYHPSSERVSATQRLNINAYKSRMVIRNQTQAKVVRTLLTASDNLLYASDTISGFSVFLPSGENRKIARALVLAIDLRVLAFVVQQKYMQGEVVWSSGIPEETTYRAVQRVQTYMRNVLVDEVVMDSDVTLNAELALAHADVGVAGLFLYPLDDVGTHPALLSTDYAQGRSVYASFNILDLSGRTTTPYKNTQTAMLGYGGAFQAGAYLYASIMATAAPLNHRDVFAYHPDGRWSLATGPIFHYAGPSALSNVVAGLDLSLMRQIRLDAIYSPAKTSHLAALNAAYGKTYSESDFLCAFSLEQDVFNWIDGTNAEPGETVNSFLKAITPSGAVLYFYLEGYSRWLSSATKFFDNPIVRLSWADARFPVDFSYSTYPKITGFTGSLVPNTSGQRIFSVVTADPQYIPLCYDTAVLNGSAYFF